MIKLSQARALVEAHFASLESDIPLRIIDEHTQEHPFGWVFFYNSTAYLETGEASLRLAGNAPVIVERATGRVLVTGTAYPLEKYLEAYRATGDPHSERSDTVRLVGWRTGARKVAAIRVIREYTGVGLRDAKRCVDDCLSGETASVEARDDQDADHLLRKLQALGFDAERTAVR